LENFILFGVLSVTIFGLSKRESSSLAAMVVIATFVWGLVGFVLICFMQLVSMQVYAKESADKHGLAVMQSSRLGGLVAILGAIVLLILLAPFGIRGAGDGPLDIDWVAWLAVGGCVSLGLVEDFRNGSLSPRFRVTIKAIIWGGVLWHWPMLVPSSLGVPFIDQVMAIPALAFLLCLIFCVGFINAVNMADGANGLVSSIVVMANIIFYIELGGVGFITLVTAFSVFLLFNVVSGRLFLGDAGAYGAGACILITSLFCYAEGYASLSFLAALLCYPCLDFLFSIIRRLSRGRSVAMPDNDHLHNRIYYQYSKVFDSKNMANSAAGLTVAGASTGVVLLGYVTGWLSIMSAQWSMVFAAQCVLYGLAYYFTGKSVRERAVV
jgi:UDP-GlcNAc:undecaprenyl-phosphate GlcNAc-1-phosphate transferase